MNKQDTISNLVEHHLEFLDHKEALSLATEHYERQFSAMSEAELIEFCDDHCINFVIAK